MVNRKHMRFARRETEKFLWNRLQKGEPQENIYMNQIWLKIKFLQANFTIKRIEHHEQCVSSSEHFKIINRSSFLEFWILPVPLSDVTCGLIFLLFQFSNCMTSENAYENDFNQLFTVILSSHFNMNILYAVDKNPFLKKFSETFSIFTWL